MKTGHTFSANITGDFDGLFKELMDSDPTLYVEAVDGRIIPVCRIVKDPDCPQELFDAIVKHLLQ